MRIDSRLDDVGNWMELIHVFQNSMDQFPHVSCEQTPQPGAVFSGGHWGCSVWKCLAARWDAAGPAGMWRLEQHHSHKSPLETWCEINNILDISPPNTTNCRCFGLDLKMGKLPKQCMANLTSERMGKWWWSRGLAMILKPISFFP